MKEALLNPTVIVIVLTGIGALLGYGLRYQLDKQKELQNEVNKERREVYQKLVNLTIDLFTAGKTANEMNDEDMAKFQKQLVEIYKKEMLYASPEVVNAFGDLMQTSYGLSDPKATPFKILTDLTNLIGTMRTDLGLSNTGLGNKSERLLKPILTDYYNNFK